MSTSTNDGGPAFPNVPSDPQYQSWDEGMSLRDWFAGQALASSFVEAVKLIPSRMSAEDYAESLYGIADAMLAARNTQTSKP